MRDDEPALWALDAGLHRPRRRSAAPAAASSARVRVEDYGAGRIRPHERTHPGPKEDRLRLTRATRANLSPIFSLYDDPAARRGARSRRHATAPPWGEVTDDDGTVHRLWRVADADAIDAVAAARSRDAELLIADGHHRYETARVYADEVGGEGPHRYVLMCLVALEDPGLTVFPTHRLVRGLDDRPQRGARRRASRRDFDIARGRRATSSRRRAGDGPLELGYIDAHFTRAVPPDAEGPARSPTRALPGHAEPYRRARHGRARGADPEGRARA